MKSERCRDLCFVSATMALLPLLASAVGPHPLCAVCGDGREVTRPNSIFSFPDQPSVTCVVLQEAGRGGFVPLVNCPFLPGLVEPTCGCADVTTEIEAPTIAPITTSVSPVAPVSAPISKSPTIASISTPGSPGTTAPNPTTAPVTPEIIETHTATSIGRCPDPPETGCSVCGAGLCVTNPDALFSFPPFEDVPCGLLEEAGFQGAVPIDSCPFLSSIIDECGCASERQVTETSVPVPPPTFLPVPPPTGAPTPLPTEVAPATLAPTSSPTLIPVPPPTATPILISPPVTTLSPSHIPAPTFLPVPPPTLPPIATPLPTTAAPTSSVVPGLECPDVSPTGCSICGEGRCVTLANALFSFPNQPDVPCGVLQNIGESGEAIGTDECIALSTLVQDTCGCADGIKPAPSVSPMLSPPTMSPTFPPDRCPTILSGGCSVCGNGMCITNPDSLFSFPGENPTTCRRIEEAGRLGMVDDCAQITPAIYETCGCAGNGQPQATPSPVATTASPVTLAPSLRPTIAFTPQPTLGVLTPSPMINAGDDNDDYYGFSGGDDEDDDDDDDDNGSHNAGDDNDSENVGDDDDDDDDGSHNAGGDDDDDDDSQNAGDDAGDSMTTSNGMGMGSMSRASSIGGSFDLYGNRIGEPTTRRTRGRYIRR